MRTYSKQVKKYLSVEDRLILTKEGWQEYFERFNKEYESDFDDWWDDMFRWNLLREVTDSEIKELVAENENPDFPYTFSIREWQA